MRHQIFLSHSHRDRSLATQFEREFRKLGVTTLVDSDISPGANWREAVMNGIRHSSLFVVLWTPHTTESDWIGYEIGSASALGKDIIVVKPASFSARDLPTELAGWRTLDFEPSSVGKAARTLVSSVAAAE